MHASISGCLATGPVMTNRKPRKIKAINNRHSHQLTVPAAHRQAVMPHCKKHLDALGRHTSPIYIQNLCSPRIKDFKQFSG